MESFHITKLAWKWELAVAVIYYHSTEGWPPVRIVCRVSLHKHVCPHCKIHHPKWHQLRLLRRSWISPRDSLIRQNLEPSRARKTAGWGNSAFWVPLVLWIGQDLQSPGSSIQLESTLNETLWMLIIRQSAVRCVIGGAQQHRHRGNLMMLTHSKNFFVGMVSVAAPAASQPLSVLQRKPIFVSLIVPAVNAEKMEAVGCCKATAFQWACEVNGGEGHWNSRYSWKVSGSHFCTGLRSSFSSHWSWVLLQHTCLCGHPAYLFHPRPRDFHLAETVNLEVSIESFRHLLLKDSISPWHF